MSLLFLLTQERTQQNSRRCIFPPPLKSSHKGTYAWELGVEAVDTRPTLKTKLVLILIGTNDFSVVELGTIQTGSLHRSHTNRCYHTIRCSVGLYSYLQVNIHTITDILSFAVSAKAISSTGLWKVTSILLPFHNDIKSNIIGHSLYDKYGILLSLPLPYHFPLQTIILYQKTLLFATRCSSPTNESNSCSKAIQ